VGVYLGSPTSLVRGADGEARGLTVALGQAFAKHLGVPMRMVEYPRLVAVLDDLKLGKVDFTVTNASPARAKEMTFSNTVVSLELGYLALKSSKLQAIGQVDQVGVRVGVTQGSSSQIALLRDLKQAKVVPATSVSVAKQMLLKGEFDVYATNKAILNEMLDTLPEAQLLPGRWGEEHLAVAIPLGREAQLSAVQAFVRQAQAQGMIAQAASLAGLRGWLTTPN
jgi:polar amino acid transport system substrate-binding protein